MSVGSTHLPNQGNCGLILHSSPEKQGAAPTFFWRFRQNKMTSTNSRMIPMPTMSRGKFDARVTIRSIVLIWDAESSSIVAVYSRERRLLICVFLCSWEQVCLRPKWRETLTSLTNMMGKMVSLICLVLLQGRKRKREREDREVREDIWLNMWPKLGQTVTIAKWVRDQQSSAYGKPWILFRMILSWALLQARMGTPVV